MDLPPSAPTPPVGNGGNMASNSDRTANLLNLLKFSGANAHQQRMREQQQQATSQPETQQSQEHEPQPAHQHQPSSLHSSPPHHQQQYHQQSYGQQNGHNGYSPQQYQSFQQQQPPKQLATPQIHQPAPTSADPTGLLAALMRGAQDNHDNEDSPQLHHSQLHQHVPLPAAPAVPGPGSFGNSSPPADTKSFLLNLLNQPKPRSSDQTMPTESSRSDNYTPQSPELSDRGRWRDSSYSQGVDAYTAAQQYQASKSFGDFQYAGANTVESESRGQESSSADVNALYQQLMGSLAQSSPQDHGHHSTRGSQSGQPFQSYNQDHSSPAGSHHRGSHHASDQGSAVARSPDVARHQNALNRTSSLHSHHSHHSQSHQAATKQTPTSTDYDRYHSADENKETVAEAVSDIAGQADRDAREALERAEHHQAQAEIAEGLEEMMNATSDEAFQESAQAAAQALKHELDRSDNEGVLEAALPAHVAEAVHDIVDDAALGVVDSWESADQEEIVVIEENAPPAVKVYNFPMKPWISISLQDEESVSRPLLRNQVVMEIARLKKDFDQIDRNLYTASANYMTYGMSKQGGLRIIRQDDGRDAKAFTDTKDRIFNVAMSVTPQDYEGAHKEAIIGTGISGTVYWVQIKDGDKDHVEDKHLEQYGFALPPMSSQEGDAPGGVLKTRARASTAHPEYFAVGRGKSINFIWPSYIMQNNMFKPGHDRVVDTEKLLQQCSLKINTGKAGKDFTFSQDDSVVVSLDKSGRVKFWDVRDLTATQEGCDPRHPVPAQSSLEIKEPLMTLASTPEGEKAWPTSVLLLDKQRPYQKRCALRYMIVGMKQNHTLQLWDLALGKPVQEFNLPHSKESDAVCSVMYHPASGMIIIGHPTRNSIYFAHLSAPKYNLKSVSQAEYMQRLVAQDSSIPQPDSTAVISGVREYSFEDRGKLRSLDILCNPASGGDGQPQLDEPTLFELYAMHSKGVACLLIKQHELGWSKDNKVLEPVDAVTEGVVVVSKLKSIQAAESNLSEHSQTRNGSSRPTPKESLIANTPSQSDVGGVRGAEFVAPIRPKNEPKPEPKEVETPVQSSKEGPPEKAERRSRKKKGAANATDAPANGAVPTKAEPKPNNMVPVGMSNEALESAISNLETRLGANLSDTLKSSLKNLHGKIDEGARVRDESFNQHQLKLLDQVSEVLNDNTQKVLESLIHQQFTDLVIPAIGDKAGKALTELLTTKLQPNMSSAVQKEIQSSLPTALNRSLRSNDFVNALSDRVGASVTSTVQQEVMTTVTQRLTQSFQNIANGAAQRVAGELHKQYQNEFELLKAQRAADSQKIDQLLTYVTQLTTTISTMAATQQSIQDQFLKLKQSPAVHELPGVSGGHGPPSTGGPQHHEHYGGPSVGMKPPSHTGSLLSHTQSHHTQSYTNHGPQYARSGGGSLASPHGSTVLSDHGQASGVNALAGAFANSRNKANTDADHDLTSRIRLIEQLIQEGRLQDAIIQWIQSGRDVPIFRECLVRYPASKFEGLSPLILLVVMATVSKNLKPNPLLKQEVEWIEMAIRSFNDSMQRGEDWDKPGSREVLGSTSQTMQLLLNRVKPLLKSMQDGYPVDPFLSQVDKNKLEWIAMTSGRILDQFSGNIGRYE